MSKLARNGAAATAKQLVNAEKMAETHPETFGILPREQRESLKVGDFAKVCIEPERFWVRIFEVRDDKSYVGGINDGKNYFGTIKNDLIVFDGLNAEDGLQFGPEHIYEIATLFPEELRVKIPLYEFVTDSDVTTIGGIADAEDYQLYARYVSAEGARVWYVAFAKPWPLSVEKDDYLFHGYIVGLEAEWGDSTAEWGDFT